MTKTFGFKNGTTDPYSLAIPTAVPKVTAATSYQEPADNAAKMLSIQRDFRSDTLTAPTDEMFEIMKAASRGDDMYGEDTATNTLQERIAALTGKEAALFCLSGTMTNQLAIRTWLTQPPHSVIVDARAHVHNYEGGGIAMHSQAMAIPVSPSNGHSLTLEDITPHLVLSDDVHFAPTKLVCLENTIKGLIHSPEEVLRISEKMHSYGLKMHCDGARLWEVSAKTCKSMKELSDPFDSLSLCMSKGLGAPVGSILVGPQAFINKARWFRKMFGGGIRQSGSLAAAASFCLDRHFPLLPRTHALAKHLACSLHDLGVRILLPVETNHVFIDPAPLGVDIWELCDRAKQNGIRMCGSRLIVHVQTSEKAVDELVEIVKEMKEAAKGRKVPEQDPSCLAQSAKHIAGELNVGFRNNGVNVA